MNRRGFFGGLLGLAAIPVAADVMEEREDKEDLEIQEEEMSLWANGFTVMEAKKVEPEPYPGCGFVELVEDSNVTLRVKDGKLFAISSKGRVKRIV